MYDLGFSDESKLGLSDQPPSTLSTRFGMFVTGLGFRVKKYRVVSKLSVHGAKARALDTSYWGSLYVGDGDGIQNGRAYSLDAAFELRVPAATESTKPYVLSVSYESGKYADVPLSCTGKLPTELEARGPKPNGLALAFSCTVAATNERPKETFGFSAIRLDVPGGTELLKAAGKDVVFDVPETSELDALNHNTATPRSSRAKKFASSAKTVRKGP